MYSFNSERLGSHAKSVTYKVAMMMNVHNAGGFGDPHFSRLSRSEFKNHQTRRPPDLISFISAVWRQGDVGRRGGDISAETQIVQ